MSTVHYADLSTPMSCRLEIVLADDGTLRDLTYQLFAAPKGDDELILMRSMVFAGDIIRKAEAKGLLIEDVLLRLKAVDLFAVEYAIAKAVADTQAEFWRGGTVTILKRGRAA